MADKSQDSKAGKVVLGTALAAAAGYVAGILTAPKSGKETRKDIQKKANETYAAAEKQLKKLHTDLDKQLGVANEKLAELKKTGGAKFDELLAQGNKAKEKARVMLSGLHEGEVNDDDLKKAISEATKAVENLRNYLKK